MKKPFQIPDIPESERTPLVQSLLEIIELMADKLQKQEEEAAHLKDEIRVLKGEKKRPKFQSGKMDKKTLDKENADKSSKAQSSKRAGSQKQSKNAQLTIHEEEIIAPKLIPAGSRFKGYQDTIIQDIVIKPHTTRYRLERWQTPEGEHLVGRLPGALEGNRFGPTLLSYVLYQHHHCQVTQPLLLEQLREWGISISSGQIDRLLTHNTGRFHEEKNAIVQTGLMISDYITVDDSGARHAGNNGYVTQIGNELFAWFESTDSKSRVNFLQLLRAGELGYRLNQHALSYMKKRKLPTSPLTALTLSSKDHFVDAQAWEQHLDDLGITTVRHRTIATEGALLGVLFKQGLSNDLVIVSDDAGQFDVLLHALCWIHMERLIHTMIPLNDQHRQHIATIRNQVWTLYADLKAYKESPSPAKKHGLKERFDQVFTQKTSYSLLNALLKRIHANKSELLLVLDRPEIPLHTNGSETDIRDYVKKRKVSGGTRSNLGRQCRDTFASIKKTCRKLGVSFWQYLNDRTSSLNDIPPLTAIMQLKAKKMVAPTY